VIKLREQNGEFSLIKYYREEENTDRWSNYAILEISGENVDEYLKDILDVEVTVEKRRDLYLYKNTRIHLDNVKNLGEYIELETVSDDLSESEAKEEFEYVLNALNLNKQKEIRKSYKDLLFNY
jgi:predicted adenylyl cyclase CyaB